MLRKVFITVSCSIYLFGANLHYSLIKKNGEEAGNTLLVVGGIHGDEPGGYFAPMLLSKYYRITKGSLWIVPNLNFDSIVANQRGIYGDMNRKFDTITESDKDFKIVTSIKELITHDKVNLVLNLHDGRGFYRQKDIDGVFNTKAWGQATIIDQIDIANVPFGNLGEIASQVSKETNIHLNEDVHEFNVKNTNTKDKDKEMQLSLTYFAIKNNKPAFAIETSKNLPTLNLKAYYQLQTIEKYMSIMNIEFERKFELKPDVVNELLNDNGEVEISGVGHFDLNNIASTLNYFPFDKDGILYSSNNPLIAIIPEKNLYKIMNGNKLLSKLSPQIYTFDNSLKDVDITIDGNKEKIAIGSVFEASKHFKIAKLDGYRVNVIGFNAKGDESEIQITPKEMQSRFAIDNEGLKYRIEFYKEDKFCGMILVKFAK